LPTETSKFKTLNTLVGLGLIGGILAIIISTSINNFTGFFKSEDYIIQGFYNNIGELKAGAPVSIGGIKVGEVMEISLQPDKQIKVTAGLQLKTPIPANSIMAIDSTTVSGDTFVSLIRGDSINTIKPISETAQPTVLQARDFFNISSIGSFAGTLGESATEFIDSFQALFGKDSRTANELRIFQLEREKMSKEISAFKEDLQKREPEYNKLGTQIERCVKKADEIKVAIDMALPESKLKSINQNLTEIAQARSEINKLKEQNKAHLSAISGNLTRISNWAASFKVEGGSIIGVLTSDKCSGLPATLSLIDDSINKVSNFSLMKKLGFYFDAKSLFSDFIDQIPETYTFSPSTLYSSWAKFRFKRSMARFRTTPDGCQIRKQEW